MTARKTALITLGGLTGALTAFALFGLVPAGLVVLATLWTVATGPSVVGTWRLSPDEADINPAEVRQYRKDHPGTTVSEAAAAVAVRTSGAATVDSPRAGHRLGAFRRGASGEER